MRQALNVQFSRHCVRRLTKTTKIRKRGDQNGFSSTFFRRYFQSWSFRHPAFFFYSKISAYENPSPLNKSNQKYCFPLKVSTSERPFQSTTQIKIKSNQVLALSPYIGINDKRNKKQSKNDKNISPLNTMTNGDHA